MTVGGRRSGVPSGESRFHATAHVMSLAHSTTTGHRQQQRGSYWQQPARPGKGGSGDRSSVACSLQHTSPVAQACRGMGRGDGGGEQASDPTFLIQHVPIVSSSLSLHFAVYKSSSNISLRYHHRRAIVLLLPCHPVELLLPNISCRGYFQNDNPLCEEEYSPPGHQPQLFP